MSEKACSTCGEVKPLTAYSVDKRHADGRQSRCLLCHRAYQNRLKVERPETYKARRRREYERVKASGALADYRTANVERMRAADRARRAGLSLDQLEQARNAHRAASADYRARNPDLCSERIAAWRQANPGITRHYVHVRRVRTRGRDAPERFTRQEIGERDGWVCGICGGPVDPALKWPHRMSQSLDHIRALSLGGEHTRANSRISHYLCNVRRGAQDGTEHDDDNLPGWQEAE